MILPESGNAWKMRGYSMNNPSSFSSISFEYETAKQFKKLSEERNESHSVTLRYLMETHSQVLKEAEKEIEGFLDDLGKMESKQ